MRAPRFLNSGIICSTIQSCRCLSGQKAPSLLISISAQKLCGFHCEEQFVGRSLEKHLFPRRCEEEQSKTYLGLPTKASEICSKKAFEFLGTEAESLRENLSRSESPLGPALRPMYPYWLQSTLLFHKSPRKLDSFGRN